MKSNHEGENFWNFLERTPDLSLLSLSNETGYARSSFYNWKSRPTLKSSVKTEIFRAIKKEVQGVSIEDVFGPQDQVYTIEEPKSEYGLDQQILNILKDQLDKKDTQIENLWNQVNSLTEILKKG